MASIRRVSPASRPYVLRFIDNRLLGEGPSIVALALLATAAPAAAQDVYVLVVTGDQPAAVRGRGATGLYVPGQGLYVSREEALERLGRLPQQPCGAIGQCEFELFVSVRSSAPRRTTSATSVTILGDGYRGILVSDQTRIPGLVTISDIRETVEALETGRDPPVEWQASDHPLEELRELDERLSDARAAQAPATIALTLALIALAALALLTRSALARARRASLSARGDRAGARRERHSSWSGHSSRPRSCSPPLRLRSSSPRAYRSRWPFPSSSPATGSCSRCRRRRTR